MIGRRQWLIGNWPLDTAEDGGRQVKSAKSGCSLLKCAQSSSGLVWLWHGRRQLKEATVGYCRWRERSQRGDVPSANCTALIRPSIHRISRRSSARPADRRLHLLQELCSVLYRVPVEPTTIPRNLRRRERPRHEESQ